MTELVQLVANGAVEGSILALAALGVTLIYGLLRIANFAYGEYMTLGAYVAYIANVTFGLSIALAALAAAVAIALYSVALEYVFWRPLRRRQVPFVGLFLASLGLALVMRYGIFLWQGPAPRTVTVDRFSVDEFAGIRLARTSTIAIVVAVVAITVVSVLLTRTLMGKATRALADSPTLTSVSGVNPDRVILVAWIVAGAAAGLAGVLESLVLSAFTPDLGSVLILPIFAAVILGGIGSPFGALVAGFVVGIAAAVSTWDGFAGGVDPAYKPVVVFALLIAVLIVRPNGILGRARLA